MLSQKIVSNKGDYDLTDDYLLSNIKDMCNYCL